MLGNKEYCYPLTITDYRSRYLLACDGLASTRSDFAFTVFERAFKDFGCRRRSAPITACPLLPAMRSLASPGLPSVVTLGGTGP